MVDNKEYCPSSVLAPRMSKKPGFTKADLTGNYKDLHTATKQPTAALCVPTSDKREVSFLSMARHHEKQHRISTDHPLWELQSVQQLNRELGSAALLTISLWRLGMFASLRNNRRYECENMLVY